MRYLTTGIMAALVAALVACGNDNGGGGLEPPPPVRVAHLEVVTDTALVFTGEHVRGHTLVRAWDANHVLIPDSLIPAGALSYTVPSGWQVKGDTIIASETETAGRLVVMADEAEPVDVEVTAGIDLRAYDWSGFWKCRMRPGDHTRMTGDDPSIWVDSAEFQAMAVDSIVYQGDGGWVPNYGGVAQVWLSGTAYFFRSDAATDTVELNDVVREIARQAPDTLVLLEDVTVIGSTAPAVKVSDSPLTYVGGHWCPQWSGEPSDVGLVGMPK